MRSAVFVDAGYLFAQGSVLLTGSKQRRESLSLDIAAVVSALAQAAKESCELPLLRIYWYDAMRLGRPTSEQSRLADTDNIKVRLGQINAAGEQKGVDALIITDLVELARNHAITDAVIVSGDEDIRVGVVLAQQFGVRVHLLGISPSRGNQSPSLIQECDTHVEWNESVIRTILNYSSPESPAGLPISVAADTALDAVIDNLVGALAPIELTELKTAFARGEANVPQQYDRALLKVGRTHYGQVTLTLEERSLLRSTFIRLVCGRH